MVCSIAISNRKIFYWDTRGNVKIADFGIAKLLGDEKDAFTLTGTGASLGTPHYMAPEQFENPAQVDHRADIYSLGVVFYEMLTGELPLGRFTAPSEHTSLDQRIDAIVMRRYGREGSQMFRQQIFPARRGRQPSKQFCSLPSPSSVGFRDDSHEVSRGFA